MEAECGAGAPGSSFPNDACYKYQWHMRQLGMPDAWKRGNGKGVIVAVIDTGVTQGGRSRRHEVRARLQLHREQRQRRRRPRPRHPRRRDHRAVDQQQARRRRRRLRRHHHAAQGAERARLGLGRRHRAGDPLGGRPRRQRHQHEPRRPDANGQHGRRREVRARQGRRHRRGGGQRRARPCRLPGGLPGRGRGGGHAVRRDHDLLFELGQGDRRRRAGRQHPRRPERRRQARRRPATHASFPATRRRPTTCGSWGRRWRRRTRRAWQR